MDTNQTETTPRRHKAQPKQEHPAKYNKELLPIFASMLRTIGAKRIIDPMAGVGTIFLLNHWLPRLKIDAVELQPAYAAAHALTQVGNAAALNVPDSFYDAWVVSPPYGNRMADHHEATDESKRNTYKHTLDEPLEPGSVAALQWGPEYRAAMQLIWIEAARTIRPEGHLVLNHKNHFRKWEVQYVTEWHIECLAGLGFHILQHMHVPTPGNRQGANGDLRIPYESVILFRLTK